MRAKPPIKRIPVPNKAIVEGSGVAETPPEPFPVMVETVTVAEPNAPPASNETLIFENVPNVRVEPLLNRLAPVIYRASTPGHPVFSHRFMDKPFSCEPVWLTVPPK